MTDRATAIQASTSVVNLIANTLDDARIEPLGDREWLSGAAAKLAIEHHAAIVHLLDSGHSSSALALARPAIETFCRGRWIQWLASDSKIQKLKDQNDAFPNIKEIFVTLSKIEDPDRLFAVINSDEDNRKLLLNILHSATHGGVSQLNRMYEVQACASGAEHYWDEQLEALLIMMNTIAVHAASDFCNSFCLTGRNFELRRLFGTSGAEEIRERLFSLLT